MILYVNGDSHSAGAEAVNSYAFAEDDPAYKTLKRLPHPDNLTVSYGYQLAKYLNFDLYCDAESASSNDRVIRTTKEYLKSNTPNLIIIGWSTWEREEWFCENQYWQVNAGGVGSDWPNSIKAKYRDWVHNLNLKEKQESAHEKIWNFHLELKDIPHIFFNTFSSFDGSTAYNWQNYYINPYDKEYTFYHWLAKQGFKTVSSDSYHYGADAHKAWAKFLLTRLSKDRIITT